MKVTQGHWTKIALFDTGHMTS